MCIEGYCLRTIPTRSDEILKMSSLVVIVSVIHDEETGRHFVYALFSSTQMMEEELRTLPPGIDGNHTGTLTICFRQCSVPNVVGNIKFWGGNGYSVADRKSVV